MAELSVPHDPASAAVVRHSLAADLDRHHIPDDRIDDVVLVASELVGNAVLHAAARFGRMLNVSWDVEPDAVVVRVVDGSTEGLPHRRSTSDEETGGRGLTIVAALASDWGVLRDKRGKQVWARVPVTNPVPA